MPEKKQFSHQQSISRHQEADYIDRFGSSRSCIRSYPLEMHIVCQNTKYEDMTEATQRPDGLAVLAVWFEVGESLTRWC